MWALICSLMKTYGQGVANSQSHPAENPLFVVVWHSSAKGSCFSGSSLELSNQWAMSFILTRHCFLGLLILDWINLQSWLRTRNQFFLYFFVEAASSTRNPTTVMDSLLTAADMRKLLCVYKWTTIQMYRVCSGGGVPGLRWWRRTRSAWAETYALGLSGWRRTWNNWCAVIIYHRFLPPTWQIW